MPTATPWWPKPNEPPTAGSMAQLLDLHAEMARLTLAIVGRTLFATDVESAEAREVTGALHEILSQFGRQFSPWFPITERLPLPATRRFDRAVAVFDRLISSLIAERTGRPGRGDDLLSLLLAAQEDGAGMTDRQVRDEAVTLFLAGHETTSNALTWTWWLLVRHPEVEARLHAELDEVLGERSPDAGRPRAPAVHCVRSWPSRSGFALPPGRWAVRRCAPHELGGITLPEGSVVVVSPWVLHHDERWWPEADAFARSMARARPGASAPRLPAVRRRPAHVHRRRVRVDGGRRWSWRRSRNGGGSAGALAAGGDCSRSSPCGRATACRCAGIAGRGREQVQTVATTSRSCGRVGGRDPFAVVEQPQVLGATFERLPELGS